jgi:hypothetical protein
VASLPAKCNGPSYTGYTNRPSRVTAQSPIAPGYYACYTGYSAANVKLILGEHAEWLNRNGFRGLALDLEAAAEAIRAVYGRVERYISRSSYEVNHETADSAGLASTFQHGALARGLRDARGPMLLRPV